MGFLRRQIQALLRRLPWRRRDEPEDPRQGNGTTAPRRGYPSPEIQSLIDWRVQVLQRPNVEVVHGELGSFLCRPNELLCAAEDEVRVPSLIRRQLPVPIPLETVPVNLYRAPQINVPQVLRRAREEDPSLRIGPNLVLTGAQAYQGFPGGWPTPAPSPPEGFFGEGDGPIVAVLDTGYTVRFHESDGLNSRFGSWGPPQTDEDLDVTTPLGWRDLEAGHATFICGIIAQGAPRARLRVVPTLNSDGDVDEVELLRKIEELVAAGDVDIVNLSLGGRSGSVQPPVLLQQALAKFGPGTAILAAAGNAGPPDPAEPEQPIWPAQLDRDKGCADKVVFAIGALDEDGETAEYSTEPADIYAPGTSVSAFIEFDEKRSHSGKLKEREPQTFEGYARWTGTSFATAVVAAQVANAMPDGGSALAVARGLCEPRTV
jgi:hypothetical protein